MAERVTEHIRTLHWLVMKTVAYEHLQVKPPSTTREAPVIYLASSEARNRAAYATSHASPIFPIGTCASRRRIISSTPPDPYAFSRGVRIIGVFINPGRTQFARTP